MRVLFAANLGLQKGYEDYASKWTPRHSPEQIVRKIQEADRVPAGGGGMAAVLRLIQATKCMSGKHIQCVPELIP